MPLSKVLRGVSDSQLKRVGFLDFDGGGAGEWSGEESPAFEPLTGGSEEKTNPSTPSPLHVVAESEGQAKVAFERGRQEGRQEGLQEARSEFDKTVSALGRGLEEISRLRESLLTTSSQDMLRLVLAIARQVIGAEVTIGREVILSTIDRALKAAVRSDSYHIKVHPDELALVRERKPLFHASVAGLKNITFEGDPSVAPGGCLVESELGEVDATLDTQIEEIRRTLLEALEKG